MQGRICDSKLAECSTEIKGTGAEVKSFSKILLLPITSSMSLGKLLKLLSFKFQNRTDKFTPYMATVGILEDKALCTMPGM